MAAFPGIGFCRIKERRVQIKSSNGAARTLLNLSKNAKQISCKGTIRLAFSFRSNLINIFEKVFDRKAKIKEPLSSLSGWRMIEAKAERATRLYRSEPRLSSGSSNAARNSKNALLAFSVKGLDTSKELITSSFLLDSAETGEDFADGAGEALPPKRCFCCSSALIFASSASSSTSAGGSGGSSLLL